MKNKIATILIALVVGFGTSCGTVKRVGKATSKIVTGGSEAPAESVWNSERTWKRVKDNPPTYVPYNYTGPVNERGEWLRDERDGKRLFVPPGGVEGFPESVLRAEAWKATRKNKLN